MSKFRRRHIPGTLWVPFIAHCDISETGREDVRRKEGRENSVDSQRAECWRAPNPETPRGGRHPGFHSPVYTHAQHKEAKKQNAGLGDFRGTGLPVGLQQEGQDMELRLGHSLGIAEVRAGSKLASAKQAREGEMCVSTWLSATKPQASPKETGGMGPTPQPPSQKTSLGALGQPRAGFRLPGL